MNAEQLMRTYEAALATQDWQVVKPYFHPDVCVTFNDGTYKGLAEVARAFERTFALIKDEQYQISHLHWAFQNEVTAVCLYNFHWSGLINGQPASGGGRGTSVLINGENGWQIIAEHLGPAAPKKA